MGKKRMNSMTAFMNDGCYITHLARRVHKNKWSACFGQRTVITTGSLPLPAFKVKPVHFLHLLKAFSKKRIHFIKALKCFLKKFITGFKGVQWSDPRRLGLCVPWPQGVNPQFLF